MAKYEDIPIMALRNMPNFNRFKRFANSVVDCCSVEKALTKGHASELLDADFHLSCLDSTFRFLYRKNSNRSDMPPSCSPLTHLRLYKKNWEKVVLSFQLAGEQLGNRRCVDRHGVNNYDLRLPPLAKQRGSWARKVTSHEHSRRSDRDQLA